MQGKELGTNLFFGVDACKGGWAIAAVREDGGLHPFRVVGSFEEVLAAAKSASLTLIDIPIGLKSSGSDERKGDREARKFVGMRKSSVFRVPVRQAVYAERREHESTINKQCTGKGIGVQTWGIVKKIKEVDCLLSQDPALQSRVRETHPEVCFCGLNGGRPLSQKKREKNDAGLKERLEILHRFSKGVETEYANALHRHRRSKLAKDDVLDAIAAAITALKCYQNVPNTFPPASETEKDDMGLRMEIVYWRSTAD